MADNLLPLSSRPDFIPLPSDPNAKLTPEQLKALFSGDVQGVSREMVHLALSNKESRTSGDTYGFEGNLERIS